jgi:hypothetical protein
MTRSAPWAQGALAACAFAAAAAYGAGWLGFTFVYDIQVNGHAFQLGPDFPIGLFAAMLMGWAAGLARDHGRHPFGQASLNAGGLTIAGSSLWILLLWAPAGAHPGQLELLKDAARIGFTLLALGLSFALPPSLPAWAKHSVLALGVLAAPAVLFPHHAEAAGFSDAQGTLPMLLFFCQGGLALTGTAHLPSGRGWGKRGKGHAHAEPEVAILAARQRRRGPQREGLWGAYPGGPRGPDGPGGPSPGRSGGWFERF